MIPVVLDTNIIVSSLLKPAGLEAMVLLLALGSQHNLCVSPSILAEYDDVLRRPRLKLQREEVDATLGAIRRISRIVEPAHRLTISPHESDNRFLECAEAANARYLVTGNKRHFPEQWKSTRIVNAREFFQN